MMLNKMIANTLPYMPKRVVWIFSKKYIVGESLQDVIQKTKQLNNSCLLVTIDLLGEFITNIQEAEKNKNTYIEIIEKIEKNGIKANISIKPSFFGLLIDVDKCYEYCKEVVKKAAQYKNFVRIDMEDSSCTSNEIELYKKLKKEFPTSVGMATQAYLKRTTKDLEELMEIHHELSPLNFRLCKGIYLESEEISYKGNDNINKKYIENLEFMLKNKIYVAIATHDKKLIDTSLDLIEKYKVAKDKYEFQMLYGVTPQLRKKIVEQGHPMRVYLPYGKEWFGYSTRRLKENPNIAAHIIKSIFIWWK